MLKIVVLKAVVNFFGFVAQCDLRLVSQVKKQIVYDETIVI